MVDQVREAGRRLAHLNALHGRAHAALDDPEKVGAFLSALSSAPGPAASIGIIEPWQVQPDEDTPGVYLACKTIEQQRAILEAIGALTFTVEERMSV